MFDKYYVVLCLPNDIRLNLRFLAQPSNLLAKSYAAAVLLDKVIG